MHIYSLCVYLFIFAKEKSGTDKLCRCRKTYELSRWSCPGWSLRSRSGWIAMCRGYIWCKTKNMTEIIYYTQLSRKKIWYLLWTQDGDQLWKMRINNRLICLYFGYVVRCGQRFRVVKLTVADQGWHAQGVRHLYSAFIPEAGTVSTLSCPCTACAVILPVSSSHCCGWMTVILRLFFPADPRQRNVPLVRFKAQRSSILQSGTAHHVDTVRSAESLLK